MCAHWTHISVHALWCLSFSPYHICLPCLFVGVQHRGKTVQMHTVCTTVSCCLCVCVSGERPHTSGKGSTTGLLGHSTRSLKVWTNQTESDIGRLKIWRVRRIKRLKDWKYRDCKQAGNTGLKARQFQSSKSLNVWRTRSWRLRTLQPFRCCQFGARKSSRKPCMFEGLKDWYRLKVWVHVPFEVWCTCHLAFRVYVLSLGIIGFWVRSARTFQILKNILLESRLYALWFSGRGKFDKLDQPTGSTVITSWEAGLLRAFKLLSLLNVRIPPTSLGT